MHPLLTPGLISIVIGLYSMAAQAQVSTSPPLPPPPQSPPPSPARAQPEDPKAVVPPVIHRSAVRSAARSETPPVGSWADANRVVDQVGGWKAYLKEAHSAPPAAAPSAPTEKRP